MKRIIKNESPEFFENWKNNYKTKNGKTLEELYVEPEMTGKKLWRALRSSPKEGEGYNYSKHELRTEILKEQGYICCYCNQEISADDAVLEHFLPKGNSAYFSKTYDYQNIMLSCEGGQKEPKPRNIHCDSGRKEGEELAFSPLDEDCESHFDFTIDGQIMPLTEPAQQITQALGLDITKLEALRQGVISSELYENPFSAPKVFISKEKAEQRIIQLKQVRDEKFIPFCVAVIKVLQREIIEIHE